MSSTINTPAGRINSAAVWKRMLWKDGRELSPIWVILLLVAGICLWITSELVKARFYDAAAVHLCGQTFIAIFCIATGVFLFATETERRTIGLLRGLPVRPSKLVNCKLLLGLAASLLAACLTGFAANFLVDQLSASRESFESTRLSGIRILVLIPSLCFLYGVVAAMITRSSFYGFLLAGAMVFLSTCFAGSFFVDSSWRNATNETKYWLTIAATGLAVLAIVVWKAESWVEGRFLPKRSRILPGPAPVEVESAGKTSCRKPFLFLLWQSFRMARIPLAIYLIVVLSAWIGLLLFFYFYTPQSDLDSLVVVPIYQAVLFSAAVLTLVFGSTVFMRDHQQRSYRFFQQNVEHPRSFWLARLLPWWIAIFASALIINWWSMWMFARSREHLGVVVPNPGFGYGVVTDLTLQYASQTMLLPLLILLAALGVGQLFSMLVRNPIIGVIVALIVGMGLVAFGMVVAFLDESLIWFLVPIIVALYFAAWFRSKYWLADSRAWIGWFGPVVAILLTTTAVLASFVHHRANEYSEVAFDMNNLAAGLGPSSNFRIDQLEFGTAADRRETADLYRQAIRSLGDNYDHDRHRFNMFDWSDEELDRFVKTYQPAIDLMLEAAEKIGCEPFLDRHDYQKRIQQAISLKVLMAASARKLIRDGQHESALASLFAYDRILQRTAMSQFAWPQNEAEFYNLLIQWADLPDQDPKLIRSAISRIEGSRTNQIPTRLVKTSWGSAAKQREELTEQLKQRYGSKFRDLRGEQAVFELIHSLWEIEQGDYLFDWEVSVLDQLLWEEQRSKRLLQRHVINLFSGRFQFGLYDNDSILDMRDMFSRAKSIEPYRIGLADQRRAPLRDSAGSGYYYVDYVKWYREEMRRYALLRLALAAYRAEHDSYPDALQSLASYFKKNLPLTVNKGREYAWYPQGLRSQAFVGWSGKPQLVLNDRFDEPILLPFAVKQPLTKELVSFHILDDEGGPQEETDLGIELTPIGGFEVRFWSGNSFYLPPANNPENIPARESQSQ